MALWVNSMKTDRWIAHKLLDIKRYRYLTSLLGKLGISKDMRGTFYNVWTKETTETYGLSLPEAKELVERVFEYYSDDRFHN